MGSGRHDARVVLSDHCHAPTKSLAAMMITNVLIYFYLNVTVQSPQTMASGLSLSFKTSTDFWVLLKHKAMG